jgi:hypothetical protein
MTSVGARINADAGRFRRLDFGGREYDRRVQIDVEIFPLR